MRLGELVAATVADHVITRRALVAAGHPDPDGDWNLQSLCGTCHTGKTNSEDGGYGRPVRPDTRVRAQRATEAALARLAAIGAAQ
jgi:5-methylcytosine-specific restriction endonuclease McrA